MIRIRPAALVLAGGAAAALALAATAGAVEYPPPANPGAIQPKPKGPSRTLTVCQKGCRYRTIQSAVNAAKAGDTVRVRRGTYREAVRISGPRKRYLRLVGDPKNPRSVLIDARGRQNAVFIREANRVEVNGLSARGYAGNGFFVLNNDDGYRLTNLVAQGTGVYGIYAFNSRGGEISNSEAYYHNDAGFYIGQTPPQKKPKRTFVRNVRSWGNVIGWSGTNMRYVTITRSRWYNNGLGLVPNALSSEKYAPPEDNEIVDNDIYGNNFNYYAGAPFRLRRSSLGAVDYPIGTGVLVFGGQRTRIERNRIHGNFLVGAAMVKQVLLGADIASGKAPKGSDELVGNRITGNVFGNGGRNPNGRDVFYDGSGSDNCVEAAGAQNNVPADNGTFAPCPFSGPNAFNEAAQGEALGWALAIQRGNPDSAEANWLQRGSQQPIPGYTPLVRYTKR